MAALYRSLLARNPNPSATPVFYLSASPRQLSDSIRRFLRKNDFPRGVLQLKEVSIEGGDSLTDQQGYKTQRIAALFEAFPGVRFTLFGDDGERDPESFAALQARYPNQVEAVWIRRVHPDPKRARFPNQGDTAELLKAAPSK
jgi:phosphatidate phosphatase APP1